MTAPLTPRPGAPVWNMVPSVAEQGVKFTDCRIDNRASGFIIGGVHYGAQPFHCPPAPQPARLRRHTDEPLAVGLVVEDGACRFAGSFLGGSRDIRPRACYLLDRLASWARPR